MNVKKPVKDKIEISNKNISEKRKFPFTLIISISVFLLIFSLVILAYDMKERPLERRYLNLNFQVGDKLGFDVNSSELKFGIVFPGGSSTRKIVIDNTFDFPVIASLYYSREIQPYVSSVSNVSIDPNTNVTIPISIKVPGNASMGNYSGQMRIDITRND